MRIGIVIDDYKLKTYKKYFDEAGISYKILTGPLENCITLKVTTNDLPALKSLVYKAGNECSRRYH